MTTTRRTIRDLDMTVAQVLEDLRVKQLAAAKAGKPELYEQAHDFLDADADTAYPTPGIPHPKEPT